jgi:hypothetical protein
MMSETRGSDLDLMASKGFPRENPRAIRGKRCLDKMGSEALCCRCALGSKGRLVVEPHGNLRHELPLILVGLQRNPCGVEYPCHRRAEIPLPSVHHRRMENL